MATSNAKVMYLRVTGERPRVVTVAHTLNKDENGKWFAQVGWAICNAEHDDFHRKIGRTIALGRMENTKTMLIVNYPEDATLWAQRMVYLLSALCDLTYGETRVPNRLARAVTDYLALAKPFNAHG